MTNRPAVFIDRDGVLISQEEYPVDHPDKVRLLPGAARAVRRLNDRNLLAVVVSNQAAVARGYFSEDDLAAVHRRMTELIDSEAGARLDALYYCPHHPGPPTDASVASLTLECDCRKPKPGLLLRAAGELNLDLSRSIMIGDSTKDVSAAQQAGARAILLTESGHRGADGIYPVEPEFRAADISEAVDLAIREIGAAAGPGDAD